MYLSMDELLDRIERERQDDRDTRVGPSDYGKCRRQIAYRVRGYEREEPINGNRAALMGTLIHDGIAAYVDKRLSDHAWTEVHVEVPGLEREGTADVLWYFDGTLVDVKTLSARAYEFMQRSAEPKQEHVGQVETYALGVNRYGVDGTAVDVHTLVVAYVNRETGDVHEFTWAYDEQSARQRVGWLATVEQMIEDGHEMPRDGSGPGTGFPCDWCPFVRECWQTDDVPAGRSAVSQFTQTDADVEDACEAYLSASQEKSKADAALKAARERLVGISYRANGYALSWSRAKSEDVVDTEALTALAVEHGLDVPLREKFTAPRISVKRVKRA